MKSNPGGNINIIIYNMINTPAAEAIDISENLAHIFYFKLTGDGLTSLSRIKRLIEDSIE
jgi:hypothetical protein